MSITISEEEIKEAFSKPEKFIKFIRALGYKAYGFDVLPERSKRPKSPGEIAKQAINEAYWDGIKHRPVMSTDKYFYNDTDSAK